MVVMTMKIDAVSCPPGTASEEMQFSSGIQEVGLSTLLRPTCVGILMSVTPGMYAHSNRRKPPSPPGEMKGTLFQVSGVSQTKSSEDGYRAMGQKKGLFDFWSPAKLVPLQESVNFFSYAVVSSQRKTSSRREVGLSFCEPDLKGELSVLLTQGRNTLSFCSDY